MINNIASAVFGFIYISLWQSVAPVSATDTPYTRSTMTALMVLAQVFAWVSIFLPAGLNIPMMVRTGSIALEMARPIPFLPMILVRESGTTRAQEAKRTPAGARPPGSVLDRSAQGSEDEHATDAQESSPGANADGL